MPIIWFNTSGTRCTLKLLLSLATAMLSACSQVGDYKRPALPVGDSWPTPVSAKGARNVAKTDWRSFFPDPRLQVLIATALEHNRDFRIAAARVEEARANFGITRAERFPTVNAGFGRNAAHTPGSLGGSNQSISGQSYNLTLSSISYEVDFWSRVSGLSESARSSYLASEEAQRSTRLSLIADVANSYYALLEMTERAEISRAIIELREKSRSLVSRAREGGFASNLDSLQAESALESARAELAAADRERASASNALNLLVGHVPENLPPGKSLEAQEILADLAAGLPSDVLVTRPDVVAAEQRLISAHANIGVARAAFLPKILLTATYGIASKALATLFLPGTTAWTYQPTLSMPLFDAGRSAGNVDLAEAREVIAVAEYEKTIQQAFREVADLLAARTALAEQRRATEANLKVQEERLRIAQALYKGGISSYIDVLEAQRENFTAQQSAVQVRRTQLVAAAQLYKALGGGE